METLEIEISYIQRLIDYEVERVLYQHHEWEAFKSWVELFELEMADFTVSLDVLPDLITQKADHYLSEVEAGKFKAAWQNLTSEQQLRLTVRAWRPR